jgi:hypothetical protein
MYNTVLFTSFIVMSNVQTNLNNISQPLVTNRIYERYHDITPLTFIILKNVI